MNLAKVTLTGPLAFISLINCLIKTHLRDYSRALISLVLKYLHIDLLNFSIFHCSLQKTVSTCPLLTDHQQILFNLSPVKIVLES